MLRCLIFQISRHGVAIFGLGRVGCLRLEDLVKTRRVSVDWLVDIEGAKQHLESLINQFNLANGTKIANTDGAEEVFADSR